MESIENVSEVKPQVKPLANHLYWLIETSGDENPEEMATPFLGLYKRRRGNGGVWWVAGSVFSSVECEVEVLGGPVTYDRWEELQGRA